MNLWLKYGVMCYAFLAASPLLAVTSGMGMTFEEWTEEFRREAVENGISAQSLDLAFQSLQLQPEVIVLDRKQPEFRRDFQSYLDNAINGKRIKKAQKLLEKHDGLFREIERKYGVPANYLLAFWGMETNFGMAKGNYPTLNVLATLAYDTRRSAFFRSELMQGVRLVQDGMPVKKMKGSWAGAVGNFQFMPSTLHHFGVDYDNDGQIDLWDSLPDALASAANYLASEGWKPAVGWGREVILPKKFNWELIEQKKTLKEWLDEGITFADSADKNEPLSTQAELFLPAGIHGPAFLTYSNFRVILKWNNSVLYAVAVGHLADRIVSRPAFSKKYFQRGPSFTLENAQEVQELLSKMDLYSADIDGVLGKKSREAVRKFQALYGLPADGYANASLLHFMRLVLSGGEKRNKLTFDEVAELQKILAKGSYYIGPIDGKLGPATLKGIELYKKVYGISSEAVNRSLLEKMRVQFARNLENGEIDPLVKENIRQMEEQRKKRELERNRKKANKSRQVKKNNSRVQKNKKTVSNKGLKKR
ncbi:MAG: lytic murein transglycosylase [Alphaproteobacteria bacterium]|nr:lytic murein transglycosylase [Alphaproteobacteria bacterium]